MQAQIQAAWDEKKKTFTEPRKNVKDVGYNMEHRVVIKPASVELKMFVQGRSRACDASKGFPMNVDLEDVFI